LLKYCQYSYLVKGIAVKLKLLSLALLSSLTLLTACSTSSTGRSKIAFISPDKLNQMGASSFEEMKNKQKISTDAKLNAYVQCVADAIIKYVPKSAHQGDWELVVFDSELVNAFALPGGKIGVYTEILKVAKDQNQLAAIIGHEIGHVIEGHSNERLSSGQLSQASLAIAGAVLQSQQVEYSNEIMAGLGLGVQYGIIMPYGRAHEKEADIIGQDLMAIAGFDPKASVDLWKNMAKLGGQQPPEFMSTHPAHDTRIRQLTEHLKVSTPLYQAQKIRPNCVNPQSNK
jgi:predicted Zn-dependent protease